MNRVRESTQKKKPTLVLGGTGKTGRRVAKQLTARGLPVRIGSRSGEPRFDWNDAGTWRSVLQGVGAVYITYQPDLAVPGAVEAVRSFTKAALEAGVRRMVLLSGRGEEEAQRAEQALQDTDADWTIVRATWFAQNFSEGFLLDAVLSGEVALPAGDVGEPFVDVNDIADVAVAALTEDGHVCQLYELTGPRLLTLAQAVEEIAKAANREIRYAPISMKQFTSRMTEQEVPVEIVWLLTYLLAEVLDGRNAHLTDGVQRALGREPRDFSDYARDAAASGVWEGASK